MSVSNIPPKNSLFFLLIIILAACNSNETAEPAQTEIALSPTTEIFTPAVTPELITEISPTPTETIEVTETPELITFEKTIGGNRRDRGINLIQTSDGGFVFVGYTSSADVNQKEDIYLVRTDEQGDMIWSRTYGGDGIDNGWAVLETQDQGFVIVGFTNSYGAGGMDIYLVRTDENGTMLWERTYGGPNDEYGWAMVPTNDGGYVLAGQTESFGEGQEDGYVVKVDAQGEEIWSQTFGGALEDRVFSVDEGTDSGFILAGTTRSFGEGQRDLYLVKLSDDGEISWTQVFGESLDDVGHAVRRTADNGYIITGYTQNFGATSYDTWLVKTGELGALQWQQFYGGEGDDRTIFGEQTSDGGFILTGYTMSFNALGWDVFLVRTDENGEVIWHQTFGGDVEDTGYTVAQTADNGFILTGETYSFGEGAGDMYIIKVDEDGKISEAIE